MGKSPSVTSSPVLGSLAEPKTSARASPAPGAPPRPASSRARQNSLQSAVDNVKLRPSSSASNKPNGKNSGGSPEAATPTQPPSNPKPANDVKPSTEATAPEKPEPPKKEPERQESSVTAAVVEKKETKAEETDRKSESVPPLGLTITPVTTKSGRASKPSTPALATFQEAARSRPSRTSDSGSSSNPKKHQKRASTASQALAAPIVEEERVSSGQGEDDDDVDIDANEPRYCYCNGVSYGEMVACDSDDCEREWFHLACVGLKVAPGSKSESRLPILRYLIIVCADKSL
jgi:hypothetical protein